MTGSPWRTPRTGLAVVAIVGAVAIAAIAGAAALGAGGSSASRSPANDALPSGWPVASVPGLLPSASSCATPAPAGPIVACTAASASPGTATAGGTDGPAAGSDTGGAAAGSGSASGASPAGGTGGPTSSPASASPSTAPPAGEAAAPTSAVGFKVRDTVVPMAFPLPTSAAYRYGAAWRVPRDGTVRPYNLIRGVTPGGTLLRAHDGIDILVKVGTPVLAPFSGIVIDPATKWQPWDPARYGKVVVIASTESTSEGYMAMLVHLSTVKVKVGEAVTRGQVVGTTGKTGNAEATPAHLHFELRAPFTIRYGYGGVVRRLDVFDPLPSVLAADPKRH